MSIVDSSQVAGMPPEALQQALMGMNPRIQPYAALAELNRRSKAAEMQRLQAGDQAMQGAQQIKQQPPIAQQFMQGIAGVAPEASFAAGGIVAFADGGEIGGFQPEIEPMGVYNEYNVDRYPGYPLFMAPTEPKNNVRAIPLTEKEKEKIKEEEEKKVEQPAPVRTVSATPGFFPGTRKSSPIVLSRPKFKGLEGYTAEEVEAAGKDRGNRRLEEYDVATKEFKDFEEAEMRRAQERRSPTENFLRAIAGSKDLGKRRLGSSLAGAANELYEVKDKEDAEARKLMQTVMQARQLRVQARIAFESGQRKEGEQLLRDAVAMENAVTAETNRQEQVVNNVDNDEAKARVQQQQFDANKELQAQQIAATLKAAEMRSSGAGGSGLGFKKQQALRTAMQNSMSQADAAIKTNIEYMRARTPAAKQAILDADIKQRFARQAAAFDIPLDEAMEFFRMSGTPGTAPGATGFDPSKFKVTPVTK